MLDLVDSIHEVEQKELKGDLGLIAPEMVTWQRKSVEPVNYEVFVVGKRQTVEARRKRREEEAAQCAEANVDGLKEANARLTELSDLCKQLGMRDVVKEKAPPSEVDLIRQFTSGIGNSFATFKKIGDLDRSFIASHYKKKGKTKSQLRSEEVIELERAAVEEQRQRLLKIRRNSGLSMVDRDRNRGNHNKSMDVGRMSNLLGSV